LLRNTRSNAQKRAVNRCRERQLFGGVFWSRFRF